MAVLTNVDRPINLVNSFDCRVENMYGMQLEESCLTDKIREHCNV